MRITKKFSPKKEQKIITDLWKQEFKSLCFQKLIQHRNPLDLYFYFQIQFDKLNFINSFKQQNSFVVSFPPPSPYLQFSNVSKTFWNHTFSNKLINLQIPFHLFIFFFFPRPSPFIIAMQNNFWTFLFKNRYQL